MSGRGANFTAKEKDYFKTLLEDYPVLKSTKNNKEILIAKNKAWEQFTERFNARGIERGRTLQQLKVLRKNSLKKRRNIGAGEMLLCDRSNALSAISEVQECFNSDLESQTEMEENEEIILVSVLPGEEETFDMSGFSGISGVQVSGQLKENGFERIEGRGHCYERVEGREDGYERVEGREDSYFATLKAKLVQDQLEAIREEKIMRKEEHRLKILKYKAQLEYYELRKMKLNNK